MRDARPLVQGTDFPAIARGRLYTLQMNLGYLCNLSCIHCHVNAGPIGVADHCYCCTAGQGSSCGGAFDT